MATRMNTAGRRVHHEHLVVRMRGCRLGDPLRGLCVVELGRSWAERSLAAHPATAARMHWLRLV